SLRKCRRLSPVSMSAHADACRGYSFSNHSVKSGLAARSSRLRQKSGAGVFVGSNGYSGVLISAVTRIAARQCARVFHFVFLHQLRPQGRLRLGGLVAHRRDELARSDVLRRIAVAIETPRHLQRVLLPRERHAIHATVTTLTSYPFRNVDAVVEVDEVGQIVNAGPHDGIAGTETLPDGLERGTGGPDLGVAVHARLGGRDSGERRSFDRGVAIPAVDSNAAHVMRMTERHRLLARHMLARAVAAPVELREGPGEKAQPEHRAEDTQPRKSIGA